MLRCRLRAVLAVFLVASGALVLPASAQIPPGGLPLPAGASVALSQSSASRLTGETHTVWATVRDSVGSLVPDGTLVSFSVTGPTGGATSGEPVTDLAVRRSGLGGWMLRADGSVVPQGDAADYGDARGHFDTDAVALVPTIADDGYWVVSAAGEVAAFGAADHEGDLGAVTLNRPVVDMIADGDGRGYLLLDEGGGVFNFEAVFRGSAGADATRPVVDIEPTPTGAGYWVVDDGGRVWTFGDAGFFGHTHDLQLNRPIVGSSATPSGNGYWLTASDGGVFSFGDARFFGSTGGRSLNGPIVDVDRSPGGSGYWFTGRDGTIWPFGDAGRFPGGYGALTTGGVATLSFTSNAVGQSTVTAAGTADQLTVQWFAGEPAHLTLTGPEEAVPTNRPATFVATVTDADGDRLDGVTVRFDASGTGTETPAQHTVTSSLGDARFDLRAGAVGRSQVTATVSGVPAAVATVDWVAPRPDLKVSLSATPDPASAGSDVTLTAHVTDTERLGVPAADLRVDLSGAATVIADPGPSCSAVTSTRAQCRITVSAPTATTVRVTVRPAAKGTLTATAVVSDASGLETATSDNQASASVTVNAAPATITLRQDATAADSGTPNTATADVGDKDGVAVADDTLVTFRLGTGTVPTGNLVGIAPTPTGLGYWIASASGTVLAQGDARRLPAAPALPSPVVDIRSTPTGKGYWLTTADGRVIARGDATHSGDRSSGGVTSPVVAMAATPSGAGYWLTEATGKVHPFGDAGFYGDVSGIRLNSPVVAMAPVPSGRGYWFLASDGGMFTFGEASFYGSTGALTLAGKVIDLVPSPDGMGYRHFTSAGEVYSFGAASSTLPAAARRSEVVAASGLPGTKDGYVALTADGLVFAGGGARFVGPTTAALTDGGEASIGFTWDKSGTSSMTATVATPSGPLTSASMTTTWVGGPAPDPDPDPEPDPDPDPEPDPDPVPEPDPGSGQNPPPSTPGPQTEGSAWPGGGAATSVPSGYWMVGADGAVFAFGSAAHLGAPTLPAGVEASDIEPAPTGGYWIFTTRGRVLAFGDANHFGDMLGSALNAPVLDSVPTPTGRGYYMVAADGGIFAFGDANFAGSMGGTGLNAPVQSLVPDADGTGYWLVASDGGIFAFDAPFHGSMGHTRLNKPVTGMVRYGDGYLMVGEDGGIFNFSPHPFAGSLGHTPPAKPIVAVAALDQ